MQHGTPAGACVTRCYHACAHLLERGKLVIAPVAKVVHAEREGGCRLRVVLRDDCRVGAEVAAAALILCAVRVRAAVCMAVHVILCVPLHLAWEHSVRGLMQPLRQVVAPHERRHVWRPAAGVRRLSPCRPLCTGSHACAPARGCRGAPGLATLTDLRHDEEVVGQAGAGLELVELCNVVVPVASGEPVRAPHVELDWHSGRCHVHTPVHRHVAITLIVLVVVQPHVYRHARAV
jgi:hypothetical protein